jgi:FKBP-type peptidyl-prolyl cis-trans isomerase FklB
MEDSMKPSLTLPTLLLCTLASTAWSDNSLDFTDETTRINYSLGYQIGGDFKRQNVEMNADAVVQGIQDALEGGEPKLSRPEMLQTLRDLKEKVETTQKEQRQLREQELIDAGKTFMKDNAQKEGVKTTDSGLQYKVLKEGTGAIPGPTDKVTVNYKGFLLDGREFDSSFKRGKPATFQVNGVIRGWTEGLQLMKEGGKMQLFIPPQLAYARSGPLAHQTLIFEVELLSVGEPPAAVQAAPASKAQTGKSE